MINLIQISFIVLIIFNSGCIYTAITGSNSEQEGKPILIRTDNTNLFTDPASIIQAEIKRDILTMTVRYGGGCEDHEFELYWDGLFMESHPLQVRLSLSHNSNGDMCRALLTDELYFDLSLIKTKHREFYRTGQGTVIINIFEPGKPDMRTKSVEYSFGR